MICDTFVVFFNRKRMANNNIQLDLKLEFPDIYEKKCRVCLLEGTLFIFSDLMDSIKLFGGVDIAKDDTFPKYLCTDCNSLLQSAILFRKKAQETNTKLMMEFEQNNLHFSTDVKSIPDRNKDAIKSECSTVSKSYDEPFSVNIKYSGGQKEEAIKSEGSDISSNESSSYNEPLSTDKRKSDQNEDCAKREPSIPSSKVSNSQNKKKYECANCKIEFNKARDYFSHKKLQHSHIQCPVCQRLQTARLYKRHLENHKIESHVVCEVCGKLYQKGTIARHMQLHSNNLPFPCKLCPYRGRYSESLKLHMRTHTGHKPYSCDDCEMTFLTKSNLNRHTLSHTKLRPHKCNECNKGFISKRDMVLHIKTDHNGIKDYECKICGNKYGAKRVLRKHEVRVHKRDKMVPGRKPLYLQPEFKKDP